MGMTDAWMIIDSERQDVKLSRGPLLNLERRNQVPAPIHNC